MKNVFVVGHPISHSKSPVIHQFWLKKYKIPGSYEAIDIEPKNLKAFLSDINLDTFIGGNVTIPHKEKAALLCHKLTKNAKILGAVNTIYLRQGQIIGDNTDGYGFLANLDQQNSTWFDNDKNVIILGAGGATRAIIASLLSREAKTITILNRTVAKANTLVEQFSPLSKTTLLNADSLEQFSRYAPAANLLINTSSVGLNNTRFETLDLTKLSKTALVHDIVYSPLITPLLKDAQSIGLQTIDGLGMLLHQAAPGFEKWFGVFPQVTQALRQRVLDELNIGELTNSESS